MRAGRRMHDSSLRSQELHGVALQWICMDVAGQTTSLGRAELMMLSCTRAVSTSESLSRSVFMQYCLNMWSEGVPSVNMTGAARQVEPIVVTGKSCSITVGLLESFRRRKAPAERDHSDLAAAYEDRSGLDSNAARKSCALSKIDTQPINRNAA